MYCTCPLSFDRILTWWLRSSLLLMLTGGMRPGGSAGREGNPAPGWGGGGGGSVSDGETCSWPHKISLRTSE